MHYLTLVICDDEHTLGELLAPYDENMEVDEYVNDYGEASTYNPESKWDWYEVGGRWGRELVAKRGLLGHDLMGMGSFGDPTMAIVRDNVGEEGLWHSEDGDGLMCDVAVVDDVVRMPHTYSVLTPDGEWHDREDIRLVEVEGKDGAVLHDIEVTPDEGWDDEFEERFVKPYLGCGCVAFIVDRHI